MYNDKILEILNNPKNAGVVSKADGNFTLNTVRNSIKVTIKVEDNIIVDAKFKALGCAVLLAELDTAMDIMKGGTIEQALAMTEEDVISVLGEIPPQKEKYFELVKDAIGGAIKKYKVKLKNKLKKQQNTQRQDIKPTLNKKNKNDASFGGTAIQRSLFDSISSDDTKCSEQENNESVLENSNQQISGQQENKENIVVESQENNAELNENGSEEKLLDEEKIDISTFIEGEEETEDSETTNDKNSTENDKVDRENLFDNKQVEKNTLLEQEVDIVNQKEDDIVPKNKVEEELESVLTNAESDEEVANVEQDNVEDVKQKMQEEIEQVELQKEELEEIEEKEENAEVEPDEDSKLETPSEEIEELKTEDTKEVQNSLQQDNESKNSEDTNEESINSDEEQKSFNETTFDGKDNIDELVESDEDLDAWIDRKYSELEEEYGDELDDDDFYNTDELVSNIIGKNNISSDTDNELENLLNTSADKNLSKDENSNSNKVNSEIEEIEPDEKFEEQEILTNSLDETKENKDLNNDEIIEDEEILDNKSIEQMSSSDEQIEKGYSEKELLAREILRHYHLLKD